MGNSTFPNFTNFQWYRNGTAISGATQSSYTTTLPGSYTVSANTNTSCGPVTSNAFTVCQPLTSPTSHNFTGTQSLSGTLSFDGDITIAPGANITISSADIYFSACSKLTVQESQVPGVNGGKLTITNSTIRGCGQWKGIYVVGNTAASPRDAKHGKVTMDDVSIFDAYIGLSATDLGMLNIEDVTFENNHTHLYVADNPCMESLIKNCTFSYLNISPNTCGNLAQPGYSAYPTYKRQVYINSVSSLYFENTTFNALDLAGMGNENGVEAYNVDPCFGSNWLGLKFESNHVTGIYDQGFYFEACKLVNLEGNGTYNLDAKNCINYVNGTYLMVRTQDIECSNQNYTGKSAIRTSPSRHHLFIINNAIRKWERGCEFYDHNSIGFNNILENRFEQNYIGLVLSPYCYPVGNVGCNVGGGTNVTVSCNKFLDNTYGIVGTGYCVQQGQPVGPPFVLPAVQFMGADWSNMFCSAGVGAGCPQSSNKEADVVWMNGGNPGIRINYDISGTAQIKYLLGGKTLWLNSTQANSGNQNTGLNPAIVENDIPGATYQCYGSWKTDPFQLAEEKVSKFSLYPNPTNDLINLDNPLDFQVGYQIIDQLGRKVGNGAVKANSKSSIDIA